MHPRYFIKTYGCQMNVGDSEKLADILEAAGYQAAEEPEQADLLLVNTCVVRQNAEDKAAWYITSAKGLKKEKPHLVIGVCGCLVTEPGRDVYKQFPHVDLFIPPNNPERLTEFLMLDPKYKARDPKQYQNPNLRNSKFGFISDFGFRISKFITIMHGCDNFCSYCIVPHVRGRETSRQPREILEEIKALDHARYPEIFLLGQNVNSYKYGLAQLLKEIERLVASSQYPVARIRFMTNHPKDMTEEIINAVHELPHVCEYFHLPVQHGDDAMLKAMNRGYDLSYYLGLVDRIRAKMPGAAITGDVIIGYPGETDKQFAATCSAIEKIGCDACNTAAYSVRPGTAAAQLPDDVPDQVKQERLREVMEVVDRVTLQRNLKLVGATQEVLVDNVEATGRKPVQNGGLKASATFTCGGRTRTNKIVKFASGRKNLLGQLVSVKITSAQSWVLKGAMTNG